MEIIEKIKAIGIVPVIKIDNAKDAVPLANALCEGGIPCAEVTFRTSAAKDAIKEISQNCPQMLVGAGTVLTPEQADEAVTAGAKFIVSPGLNPKTVKHCIEKGIPIIPGTANPSDVELAIELGLNVVKFFPAEAAGGLNMIKAMSAPYSNMLFMPTGGIGPQNLNSYLDFPKIIACGGSWMAPDTLISAGEFNKIRLLAKEAVEKMLGFELAHIGINASDESKAQEVASSFENIFGFAKRETPASIFAGNFIEAMKSPYLGTHGHIAIKTNYLDRAVNYLKFRGIEFDSSTAKFNDSGKMTAIYLKEQFGGFAVHLLQK